MRNRLRLMMATAVSVAIAWIVISFFVFWLIPDPAVRGQVGDAFGAVNSMFSALAFAAIVISIVLQAKDLEIVAAANRASALALKRQSELTSELNRVQVLLTRAELLSKMQMLVEMNSNDPSPDVAEVIVEIEKLLVQIGTGEMSGVSLVTFCLKNTPAAAGLPGCRP